MLNNEIISQLKNGLKSGVTVQVAPQLFETPREIAHQMAEMLNISKNDKILEPSAGKGALIRACQNIEQITAIEVNYQLSNFLKASFTESKVICDDFLNLTINDLGAFEKILMNPPFSNSQDIEHITHAFNFLKGDGILIAIACEGPFFRQDKSSVKFRDFLDEVDAEIIKLPEGAFKQSGTMVNTRLIKICKK